MMNEPFYAQGLHFSCQQCSHCCRYEPGFVYISQNDLAKLSDFFAMSEIQFIEEYCRWVFYYDNTEVLCLKETAQFDCILWSQKCMAYNARPVQCRTYPFWDFLLKTEKNWYDEAKNCRGIGNGELKNVQDIEQLRFEYVQNIPLRKHELRKRYD